LYLKYIKSEVCLLYLYLKCIFNKYLYFVFQILLKGICTACCTFVTYTTIYELLATYVPMSHLNRFSTETALVKVVSDLLLAMDEGKLSVLVLLGLSAAFDTNDHGILLHRLHHEIGIRGYLGSDLISLKDSKLFKFKVLILTKLSFGVPHGSVLGPILFILYTQPLTSVT